MVAKTYKPWIYYQSILPINFACFNESNIDINALFEPTDLVPFPQDIFFLSEALFRILEVMRESKTALITGATSGIGKVIARHLVKAGYAMIVLARSEQKLKTLISELQFINSEVSMNGVICDFASLESTSAACKTILEEHDCIDVMILNAGLWNSGLRKSQNGIEETLHVNLISQVQVFQSLVALLPKDGQSKVIITSSGLHQGEIHFDDLEFQEDFSGFKAYRQSKLGLMMLTRWLAKQDAYVGISFYSVHPGMVRTNLGRDAGWFAQFIFKLLGKSAEKGAQTHIYVADTPNWALTNGAYYANKKVTKSTNYSYNLEEAGKLWDAVMAYLNKFR